MKQSFKLEEGNHFIALESDNAMPQGYDIRVAVAASGVNPIDMKRRLAPLAEGASRILGFDAVGVVEAVGDKVTEFREGDWVYYAGSVMRPGSNQTHQLVDARLVSKKPDTVSIAEAASLPLTGLTASEVLFDIFGISKNAEENAGQSILIINGAGGVGSMAIQIAKAYGLHVIATASRDASVEWVKEMGADLVLNHREDLTAQMVDQYPALVNYVFCAFNTDAYFESMVACAKPRGRLATIVEFSERQDLNLLKAKSLSFTYESMFTRAQFETSDIEMQRTYLEDIREKIDAGIYKPTLTETLSGLTPDTIYEAHQRIASQNMIGKLVIQFENES